MILSLLDVQIGVENGSPLPTRVPSQALFTKNIPNVPYIYMAPKTCAAIASHLPVVLSSYTDLYIWNTIDPHSKESSTRRLTWRLCLELPALAT